MTRPACLLVFPPPVAARHFDRGDLPLPHPGWTIAIRSYDFVDFASLDAAQWTSPSRSIGSEMILNVREPRTFHARLSRFHERPRIFCRGEREGWSRRGAGGERRKKKIVGSLGFGKDKYLRRTIIDCANPHGTHEQRSADLAG